MRKGIAGFIAGIVFATAATASAISFWGNKDVICAKTKDRIIVCGRRDGVGYQVGITKEVVMVTSNHATKRVFYRFQPGY